MSILPITGFGLSLATCVIDRCTGVPKRSGMIQDGGCPNPQAERPTADAELVDVEEKRILLTKPAVLVERCASG